MTAVLTASLSWFCRYLRIPESYRVRERAMFWLRDSAHEHIRQMWPLVAIVADHVPSVEMVTTDAPGRFTYQDEHQVAAVPEPWLRRQLD